MAGLTPTRRLLVSLRAMMAGGGVLLPDIVALVAGEMVAEVCSIYGLRAGEILELRATQGLNSDAIGRTRLRVGEGIIGLAAATGEVLNLADAQNHPAFAYRPELGEEAYASMLAVPVRRGGRTLGVIAIQNRDSRHYSDEEVEVVETIAMLLADALSAARDGGAGGRHEDDFAGTLAQHFDAAPLSPGIVFGRVFLHGARPPPSQMLADDTNAEEVRLDAALRAMRQGLDQLIAAQLPIGEASRDVLAATRQVAADEGWLRRIGEAVRGGLTAEAAVHRVLGELRERMRRIADPYLRERLADFEDLAGRLMTALDLQRNGGANKTEADIAGVILVARRLGPAQLLEFQARGIAGVIIEEGTPGGHAAILARALGLPALGGARGAVEAAVAGDDAVLDADGGALILRPDPSVREAYGRAVAARAVRQAAWQMLREAPSVTRDGTAFELFINAGLPLEVDQLDATGAAGIGLFRTEIGMLARGAITDVAEQTELYKRVLDRAGERPVLFRTLDIGSDKLLPNSPPPEEENPAMGWRSLRVGLDRPALLRRQLRALLLAADGRPLSVMFPMVTTLAEFRQARGLLFAEAARIRPAPSRLAVGTMLEVPALLWQLPDLMREADFVSVGSNDLLQFVYAADRGTPSLAERYDFLSPSMLSLLEQVAHAAALSSVSLSLCGEAASRPLDAAVLLALGYTRLSMSASSLLGVKEALSSLDLDAFRPFLERLRRTASGYSSLREPIAAWARDHGVEVR